MCIRDSHYTASAGDYTDDEWRLYSWVFSKQSSSGSEVTYNASLYENGAIKTNSNSNTVQSISFNGDDTSSTYSGFEIGNTNASHSRYGTEGYYDDFRIYDRALSAAEVEKLYYAQYIQKGSISNSTDEYIAFKYNPNNGVIVWDMEWTHDNTIPWGLQEAVNWSDDVIVYANGTTYTSRIPTQTELVDWLNNSGQTYFPLSGVSEWAFVKRDDNNNYRIVQIGSGASSYSFTTHHTSSTYIDMDLSTAGTTGDSSTWAGHHFRIVPKIVQTEYTINFPQATDCEILLLDDTNYKHLETPLESLNGTYTVKVGTTESSISKSGYTKTTATGGTAISSGYATDITGLTKTYNNKEVIIRYATSVTITTQVVDPKLSSLSSLTPESNTLLYFDGIDSINYLQIDTTTLEITSNNQLSVIGSSGSSTGIEGIDSSSSTILEISKHVIPDTNATYDIGSAEKKIRHLYLSDTSLWIGDDNKISISCLLYTSPSPRDRG